jgi:hypothetical protein
MKKFSRAATSHLIGARQKRIFARIAKADSLARFHWRGARRTLRTIDARVRGE